MVDKIVQIARVMKNDTKENTPRSIWFRVFDATTLKHICDMRLCTLDGISPLHPYDPRIGGNGEIILQPLHTTD